MNTKEAVKSLQEYVKETETIELYFQQGSSDKVYHLQLESVEEQWSVNAQWGRRGSALQSDTKVSSVAYEEAKRVYDRIIREKTGKGYRIAQATTNGEYAYFRWIAFRQRAFRSRAGIADPHRGTRGVAVGTGCVLVVPTEVRWATTGRTKNGRPIFGNQQTRPAYSNRLSANEMPRVGASASLPSRR